MNGEVLSYIFAFNLTEHKAYVYTDRGILLKRIHFADIIKAHGEVICASSNGLNFALFNRRLDTITLIRFSPKKFSILKTINVEGSLIEFFDKNKDEDLKEKAKDHWIFDKNRARL